VALHQPARDLGVEYDPRQSTSSSPTPRDIRTSFRSTARPSGDLAAEGQPISRSVAEETMRAVEDKLDESFFCVRAERTTDRELQ
jgi:hypothetical protein